MYDSEFGGKLSDLKTKIDELRSVIRSTDNLASQIADPIKKEEYFQQQHYYANKAELHGNEEDLRRLVEEFGANLEKPGTYSIRAPMFSPDVVRDHDPQWFVLSHNDFRADYEGKLVKQSENLLKIGDLNGAWEVEIKIPEKNIGQVMKAFKNPYDPNEELTVDLKLQSHPLQTFQGKLARGKIAPEAVPDKDEHNETEPVVYARVRVRGDDIPIAKQIPVGLKLAGMEVSGRVRCGKHSMGYSLFYGVWEFLNEKFFQFL
jgi:hypothetical protein